MDHYLTLYALLASNPEKITWNRSYIFWKQNSNFLNFFGSLYRNIFLDKTYVTSSGYFFPKSTLTKSINFAKNTSRASFSKSLLLLMLLRLQNVIKGKFRLISWPHVMKNFTFVLEVFSYNEDQQLLKFMSLAWHSFLDSYIKHKSSGLLGKENTSFIINLLNRHFWR